MNKTNRKIPPVCAMNAQAFDYDLPEERIAKYPLEHRDQSKLLVWRHGEITDSRFTSLADLLPEKSLLIFNNTKVIHARLLFQKPSGTTIEIFCLDPLDPADYQLSFQQTRQCTWNCMVGNLKKWKGEILEKKVNVNGKNIVFTAEKKLRINETVQVSFRWDDPDVDFATLTEAAGILPIPPYLHRETEQSDLDRYQTIYSKIKGSVAAPTAGLHFTDEVFKSLTKKHINCDEITLHVGAGTFKPVKSETIAGHEMHAETIVADRSLIKKLLDHQGRLIAVGTTSVRSLESLYWLGVKAIQQPDMLSWNIQIEQWMPYEEQVEISRCQSLEAVLTMMEKHRLPVLSFLTRIMIVPGYKFRIVDGMITNFHQPQSTLLLLISAYMGDDWKRVYEHAMENNYRFLSYGDSMLISI